MISTLHIKNIGIIDDITIRFEEGFNVLTGETGAGKTLIIDSLGIICGGRFSKEMIRKGERFSYVEMCLYLPEREEKEIIVSREIDGNGKNSCKINGRLVTVTQLKEFMSAIIDIHGQNDNQNLLNKEMHITYLDAFSDKDSKKVKATYSKNYEMYKEILQELKENYGDDKEKRRKLDLLQYQVNEIKEANLKLGEEEELEEKRKVMLNSEKIATNLQEACSIINQNVLDNLNIAIKNMEKISDIQENYEKTWNLLKSNFYDLQEICHDMENDKEEIDFDEQERKQVEERLDLIFSLKRKYGNTIEEILKYKDEVEEEINKIENLESRNQELRVQKEELEKQMLQQAITLNQIRKKSAEKLVEEINKELKDLEMQNATFMVKLDFSQEKGFQKNGLDEVEFLICTNVGEDEKPLIKIASGGEMSRIMLAIKTVLTNVDEVPVLVFDEIDTGISGKAANCVGDKLTKIAKHHQVLIVTHLASIAAKGEHNYFIHKEIKEGKTNTKVDLLNEEETIQEIARIATGQINEISLQHAKALRR